MIKRIITALIVLVWLSFGLFGTVVEFEAERQKRCLKISDLVIGVLMTCMGPVTFIAMDVTHPNGVFGCIIPKKEKKQ